MAATSGAMILAIVINVATSFSTSKLKQTVFLSFNSVFKNHLISVWLAIPYHITPRVGNNYTHENKDNLFESQC